MYLEFYNKEGFNGQLQLVEKFYDIFVTRFGHGSVVDKLKFRHRSSFEGFELLVQFRNQGGFNNTVGKIAVPPMHYSELGSGDEQQCNQAVDRVLCLLGQILAKRQVHRQLDQHEQRLLLTLNGMGPLGSIAGS